MLVLRHLLHEHLFPKGMVDQSQLDYWELVVTSTTVQHSCPCTKVEQYWDLRKDEDPLRRHQHLLPPLVSTCLGLQSRTDLDTMLVELAQHQTDGRDCSQCYCHQMVSNQYYFEDHRQLANHEVACTSQRRVPFLPRPLAYLQLPQIQVHHTPEDFDSHQTFVFQSYCMVHSHENLYAAAALIDRPEY